VAVTTTWWNNQTSVVGGNSFLRIVEADVAFSKTMQCFLGISSNLAEVACHELGHAIGLAHSSDTTAMMYAVAHGHGRDATLGNDDKSGVLTIYPASPGGGGTGGGGPLSITSVNLPNGVVGRFYKQTLNASGGTLPYRWGVAGGQMPPGLSLSSNGVLDGTPTRAGVYSIGVQVADATSGNLDSKRVNIIIGGPESSPSIVPVINRVKVKKDKKLWIYGQNFHDNSVIILNGKLFSPKSFEQDGATSQLYYKGKLNLGPGGSNLLFIQNSDNSSTAFYF
jgi:hypothetical protein